MKTNINLIFILILNLCISKTINVYFTYIYLCYFENYVSVNCINNMIFSACILCINMYMFSCLNNKVH
jgi:hypothetical protein